MPRLLLCAVIGVLLAGGCSRRPAARDVAAPEKPDPSAAPAADAVRVPPSTPADDPDPSKTVDALVSQYAAPSAGSRYDTLLQEAAAHLAEQRYARALAAFEDARAIQDTELVRREIAKVRDLIAQQAASERTLQGIRTALDAGANDEAGRLASAALEQFGGSDAAEELARLKRQADALALGNLRPGAEQRDRFAREARAALTDNNLRAASLALEQALAAGDDAELRRQYDDVRARLTRYDDARRRAADLRRDPASLEEAVAAYRDAAAAWDTLQVRQEIDDAALALQKRRDRIGIADFEVRGEVGIAAAGRTIAEELLPAFRPRFDVIERAQFDKVLTELNLEGGDLGGSSEGQQAVGRVARLRYLVLGSLVPLNGVTIHARLVEAPTGLVVQTARYSAPTVQALLPKLPLVAQMLTMSDSQKLAFEQALAEQAPPVRPLAPAPVQVPPPPPPPAPNLPPPPPIVTYTPRPPAVGGLLVTDLNGLPPVPVAAPPTTALSIAIARDEPFKQRLFALSLEVGDNLFRRGKFTDAVRHFELALGLSNGHRDIQIRIEQTRAHLPPPVVVAPPPVVVVPPPVVVVPTVPVVVAPPPVVVVRPRVVIFNFLVNCPPGLVPPAIGDWAADHYTSYCGPVYDVVERGEVCWYMGRLNLTMRDVLYNPAARRGLAQALGVRYFLFGTIEQTASFNVTAHLVDAETGARAGQGAIHVQDQNELKLRMQELVRQTGAPGAERARLAQSGAASEKGINETRKLLQAGNAAAAAATARAALQDNPGSVALQALARQADDRQKALALEAARQQEAARAAAAADAARKRQQELARQAEALRVKSEADARTRDAAARRAADEQKQKAAERLRAEARAAADKGDLTLALRSLQGAVALRPNDELTRELTQLQAKAAAAERQRQADEQSRRDTQAQQQAAAAAAKVADERRKREAEEAATRQARDARDQVEYARLLDQAKQALARQQLDAARGALESARAIKTTDEATKLQGDLRAAEAAVRAAKEKSEAARRAAELRLTEDRDRAAKADAEARQKQTRYTELLDQAAKAIADKRYDQAAALYTEAGKLYRTDAVLNGLRRVQELRQRPATPVAVRPTVTPPVKPQPLPKQPDTPLPKQPDQPTSAPPVRAEFDRLMQVGANLEKERKIVPAAQAYREALRKQPGNPAALAALRRTELPLLLEAGRQALAAQRWPEAAKSYESALQLAPDNAEAKSGLQKARAGK